MTQIKLSSLLLLTFSFFLDSENSSRGEEWKNLIDNTSLSNWKKWAVMRRTLYKMV